jgi:glucose/arabinose dehydrogenase
VIASLALALAQTTDDARFYAVDYLVPPDGARIEVGGLDFLPDGRLVVSTRRGQVWMVANPLAVDPKEPRFSLFAEGLHEGLGLEVVDGEVYVLQRGELSRLVDEDQDGACDRIDTIANGWGLSGHYHEFAFGLPRDKQGRLYAGFNVSFGDPQWWHGRSTVPDRGWIVRFTLDGKMERVACGARSPCGLGVNSAGDVFYTDNQGDWMPTSPIFHVKEGAFFGHPASLRWTPEYLETNRIPSDTVPPERERARAAIWIPYEWSRSTGNLVEDTTGGKFGPFSGQMFVAEMTNGYLLRAGLERINGEYQGWVTPFRRKVGSNVRLRFASDGTLLCGFTDRGWGGQPPSDGIGRVRWTGETPLAIKSVHLLPDCIEITTTRRLATKALMTIRGARVTQYDYNYWWEYGSPVMREVEIVQAGQEIMEDWTTIRLHVMGLQAGKVVRVKLGPLESWDGIALADDEFAYTINQLPEASPSNEHVAKLVPPPPAKQSGDEGVLHLTRGDALDAWSVGGDTWRKREVALDPNRNTQFVVQEDAKPDDWSGPTIFNGGAVHPAVLRSHVAVGDVDLHFDFMLTAGARVQLVAWDRYALTLSDDAACGAIEEASFAQPPWPGRKPTFNAYRGPGKWHGLDVKLAETNSPNARAKFVRVLIDDVLLHDEVEVPYPTNSSPAGDQTSSGPIVIRVEAGQAAFRGIRVRSREPREETAGWTPLFDGKTLDGWRASDGGQWKVEQGEIVGSGAASHLFSPRGDYKDFELRAKCKINDGGNSGLYFRAQYGDGWPKGYEAQVNSTHSDPIKTGSLYGLAPIKTQLIPPETWFDYHVTCRDEANGTHITIRVNDVVVTDFVDTERRFASGHVALQQHHDGSVVRWREIGIRTL